MGLFSLKETCVICQETAGLTRSNTAIGPICKNCVNKLIKHNVNALNIKKYELVQLQEICQLAKEKEAFELTSQGQLEKRIISSPNIMLNKGETCYYMNKASAVHQKNVVTGTKSNGVGMTFRVAKGVSVRTGGGGSTKIRENVNEFFDGTLYITNQRIILLAPKYGFDVAFSKITSLSRLNDGFHIYVGTKCHTVYSNDMDNIIKTFTLIDEAKVDTDNHEVVSNTPSSPVKEIREYKKLLDDGIITEEEFNAKKKQLLEL